VGALWGIPDARSLVDFIGKFYENYYQSHSSSYALSKTQSEFIESKNHNFYIWGGFVSIGF
jgi:CHAT domain-containing protein